MDRYDAELKFLDEHLGRLLGAIEARWKPDWLLVWPEKDADEARAERTQRRFAEVAAGFSA